MRLSRSILVFLAVSFIGQIVYYYLNLPEQMASHFGGAGQPDNWMSKNSFMAMEGIILLIIIAQTFVVPSFIEKMPDSLINLPNKEYWLAKERRAETFSIFRQFFEWFSCGLLGLFIAVNELVFRANLNKQSLSNSVWIVLIAFVIFTAIWLTKLILHFRKPV